jgi:hypothetical protein
MNASEENDDLHDTDGEEENDNKDRAISTELQGNDNEKNIILLQKCDEILQEMRMTQNPNLTNNNDDSHDDHLDDFDENIIDSFRSLRTLRDLQYEHLQELQHQKIYLQDTLQDIQQVTNLLQQELVTAESNIPKQQNSDDNHHYQNQQQHENLQLHQDLRFIIGEIRKRQQQQSQSIEPGMNNNNNNNKNQKGSHQHEIQNQQIENNNNNKEEVDPLYDLICTLIRRCVHENEEEEEDSTEQSTSFLFVASDDNNNHHPFPASDVALLQRLCILQKYKQDSDLIRLVR